MNNAERAAIISKRIKQKLSPTILKIVDDSDQHIGHAGARNGAGHFTIIISSHCFNGLSRVACHRLINDELKDLFATEIHALCIKIVTDNCRQV